MGEQSQPRELNELKTIVEITWLLIRIVGAVIAGILATARFLGII